MAGQVGESAAGVPRQEPWSMSASAKEQNPGVPWLEQPVTVVPGQELKTIGVAIEEEQVVVLCEELVMTMTSVPRWPGTGS